MIESFCCDRCGRKAHGNLTREHLVTASAVTVHAADLRGEAVGVLVAHPALEPMRFLCLACLRSSATPAPELTSEADEKKFRAWADRIRAGLGSFLTGGEEGDEFWPRERPEREGLLPGEISPRLALILEIADDVNHRFPLGIAARLFYVVSALGDEEDDSAILDLEDLIADEVKARELAQKDGKS